MDHPHNHRNQGLKNIRAAMSGLCTPLSATFEDNGDRVGQLSGVLFRVQVKDGRRLEVTFNLADIQDSHEKIAPLRAGKAIRDIAVELRRTSS